MLLSPERRTLIISSSSSLGRQNHTPSSTTKFYKEKTHVLRIHIYSSCYHINIDSNDFLLIKSIISTSSSFAVFISISSGGCDELVHHFETVVGAHPNSLDSQRLVFFFSARITFRRLRSLLLAIVVIWIFGTKIQFLGENKVRKPIKSCKKE